MNARKIIHEIFAREKSVPLDWSRGGCLRFPGMVAEALTDKDPTAAWRRRFKSAAGARRVMAQHGWKSLREAVAGATDLPEIPVAAAAPGDWAVVVNDDGSDGLGVVVGSTIAVTTDRGVGLVALTRATAAFKVVL